VRAIDQRDEQCKGPVAEWGHGILEQLKARVAGEVVEVKPFRTWAVTVFAQTQKATEA
jgi:hypothetical protein